MAYNLKPMTWRRSLAHLTASRDAEVSYLVVHENSSILSPHPEKSDVQGFMIDSSPKLSPEHDRLSWTRFRFGQLSLIGANWTLISVFPNSLIF